MLANTDKAQRAIQHLWKELDKVWDGDVRPDNWNTTCEAMAVITESLGFEIDTYDQSGHLKWLAQYDQSGDLKMNQYEHKFDFLDGVIDIQFTITEEGKQFAFVGFQDETHNSVLHDGEVVWFGSNPEFIRKDMESDIKGQLLQEHGYSVIKAHLLYSTFVKP